MLKVASFFALSLSVVASAFSCRESAIFTYQGISCCTERVEETVCKSAVDSMPRGILDLVEKLSQQEYSKTRTNSFWLAIAAFDNELAVDPRVLGLDAFIGKLSKNFQLTNLKKKGDLVVVNERVDKIIRDPEVGISRYESFLPDRSGILLNDNLVLIKENSIGAQLITIDTLSSLTETKATKGSLGLEFYRR